jgi:hypothetical protein
MAIYVYVKYLGHGARLHFGEEKLLCPVYKQY